MLVVVAVVAAAYGVHLLYTALAFRWSGVAPGPNVAPATRRRRGMQDWLAQAGLPDVNAREFGAVVVALFAVATVGAYAIFGGPLPALAVGAFAGTFPLASYRRRRTTRVAVAQEAWPRLLEEMRVLTGSVGRSIPQALFDVGARGPAELRPAFAAAHRDWLLSTDFDRTLVTLKTLLADPTADVACETLLVAHEIGGSDLDQRLAALVEDRTIDVQGRKDARAKQAGVRFARRFVLLVPAGMALTGMSIGRGRAAYQTATGQVAVVVGIALVVGCWVWAGRLLALPDEERVFG